MIAQDSRGDFQEKLNVSRETLVRLDCYAALLEKWNPAINLVSRRTLGDLWSRHFLDSAQLVNLAPAGARHWADLGSGGGFPGMVIGILGAERKPGLTVTLVESDLRKAAFLTTVAREIGIAVDVQAERIENLAPLGADILTARALAPLPKLLDHAVRHLSPAGTALFLKGAQHEAEVEAARLSHRFTLEKTQSLTEPEAVILKITGLSHA